MPEALAVFFVFTVSVIFYVAIRIRTRDPAHLDPRHERTRLQQHEAWLRERLNRAQIERWDDDMVATLEDELRDTSLQLARITASDAAG